VGKRATSFLAFVYTGPVSLDSPFDSAILDGAYSAMEGSNLNLVLLDLHHEKLVDETYTQYFARRGIRGVMLRTTQQTRRICEEIAAENFPSIVIGERFDAENVNYIRSESYTSMYRGVEHLIGLGHRRIAFAVADVVQDSDHADRLLAYENAMRDHDVSIEGRWCFHLLARRPDGAQVIRRLMSMPNRPTAIVFTDPMVGIGALLECHKLGVNVPGDLSILGFDDSDTRNLAFPTMTAICQDAKRLGVEAFKALTRLATQKSEGHTSYREELPTWLEINHTTGRPPVDECRVLPDGSRDSATSLGN
jgi:LacI family transcriptional regulator